MSSEKEYLLSKISEVAGQINRHKNQTEHGITASSPYQSYPYSCNNPFHLGSRPAISPVLTKLEAPSARGVPAYRGRGVAARARARGARGSLISHRNRTLVLNNSSSTAPYSSVSQSSGLAILPSEGASRPSLEVTEPDKAAPATATSPGGQQWVAKRDRHMQLINSSVYDQQAAARAKAMEVSRLAKLKRREEKQKLKLKRFLERSRHGSSPFTPVVSADNKYELVIGGSRYIISGGGNKLIRVPDASTSKCATPKRAVIGGVIFVRSKNGNLWRSGLVKSKGIRKAKKIAKNCKYFTMTGKCERGNTCPYIHDADRVAICPRFLATGECPDGDRCDLSHDPTPHRVPACVHFLRANCSNPKCRYAHVKVNPAAPVCRAFATEGYCEKGEDCIERHVHECPEFDRNGVCNDKKCKLPHIERASRKRMAAAAAAVSGSAKPPTASGIEAEIDKLSGQLEDSDISSDEDGEPIDSDDVDSDGLSEEDDDYFIQSDGNNTGDLEVAQQADFIHF